MSHSRVIKYSVSGYGWRLNAREHSMDTRLLPRLQWELSKVKMFWELDSIHFKAFAQILFLESGVGNEYIFIVTQQRRNKYQLNQCPGVLVYLAPWAACPPGVKLPLGSLPPGGEDTPGYLAPHPGQLVPQGWRYPGLGSLPPAPRKPDRT